MGGWTSTWSGHALYEMTMVEEETDIGDHSTGPSPDRQTDRHDRAVRDWGQTCARHVYDAWTTEQILGIQKKFGG